MQIYCCSVTTGSVNERFVRGEAQGGARRRTQRADPCRSAGGTPRDRAAEARQHPRALTGRSGAAKARGRTWLARVSSLRPQGCSRTPELTHPDSPDLFLQQTEQEAPQPPCQLSAEQADTPFGHGETQTRRERVTEATGRPDSKKRGASTRAAPRGPG